MPASYPSSIHSFTTLTDGIDDVLASHQNEPNDEITAIETELGTNPKSIDDTVAPGTPSSVGNALDMFGNIVKTISGSTTWTNAAVAAIMKSIGTAKGDIIAFTGSGTPVRVPGSTTDGDVLTRGSTETAGVKWAAPAVSATGMPPGYLYGLTLSNDGTDPTNDIDITTGKCRDSTDTVDMTFASALIKRLDANWAAGTNQGMRNSGAAITDTTYHIYAVSKADGANADYYAHTSTTVSTVITALQAETGGSAYLYARRIGSIVRSGGAILTFIQDGDQFMWMSPVGDVNATNPSTSAVTRTLTLPTGIRVNALMFVAGNGTVSADMPGAIYISDLSVTDTAPASTGASSLNVFTGGAISLTLGAQIRCMTNTSAQVRSRVQISTAATVLRMSTLGWIDTRGRI